MHTCDMTHLTTMLFHLHRCLKETQKPTLIVTQTHEPIHFKLAPYIQHQTSRTATQKKEMARSRNTSRSCNSSKDIHTKSIQMSCDLFETHPDVSTQFARETSTYTLRAREQFVWGTFTQFVQSTHHAIGKKQQIHAICTKKQFLNFHNVSPGGFALLTPWLLLCSINMYQLRNVTQFVSTKKCFQKMLDMRNVYRDHAIWSRYRLLSAYIFIGLFCRLSSLS